MNFLKHSQKQTKETKLAPSRSLYPLVAPFSLFSPVHFSSPAGFEQEQTEKTENTTFVPFVSFCEKSRSSRREETQIKSPCAATALRTSTLNVKCSMLNVRFSASANHQSSIINHQFFGGVS